MPDNLLGEATKEITLAKGVAFCLQDLFKGIGTVTDNHLPVAKGEESNERHVRVLPHPFYVQGRRGISLD